MIRTLSILILALLCSDGIAAYKRMTVTFWYRGELLKATFFSNVAGHLASNPEDQDAFNRLATKLDQIRMDNYLGPPGADFSQERFDWEQGFFQKEPLTLHDEVMIIHKGAERTDPNDVFFGIGQEIVGTLAINRLGNPMHDHFAEVTGAPWEELLVEKRLRHKGIKIPRPEPMLWLQQGLPPGVFPHWHPDVARTYFNPSNVVLGDVIQANALFAKSGTFPLLHALANAYGLLSTGRMIPPGVPRIVGGLQFNGPFVFIPSLVVWEVFNTVEKGVYRKGSRTAYYEKSGAAPLWINGRNEWSDDLVRNGNLVQILGKTGNECREGWTELFAKNENFSFVRDVDIVGTAFESMSGNRLVQHWLDLRNPIIAHHPKDFRSCNQRMLDARRQPTYGFPVSGIKIGISFGTPTLTIH